MIAVLLVAALTCGASSPQVDLDVCASQARASGEAAEHAAYAAASRRFGDRADFQATERRWYGVRSTACAFAAEMASGGSLEPMLEGQCYADTARARVRDIALFAPNGTSGSAIAAPRVAAEHVRVYGLLEMLLSPAERNLLAASERAWIAYRDAACAHARRDCATLLTTTRTQQLKDSWLAERFW